MTLVSRMKAFSVALAAGVFVTGSATAEVSPKPTDAQAADAKAMPAIPTPSGFAQTALRVLREDGRNTLVSPLGLETAIGLVSAALPDEDDQVPYPQRPELTLANAVWLDRSLTLTPAAQTGLSDIWSVSPTSLDMATNARATVNAWVADKSQGRVTELIPQDHPEATVLITSVLVFKDAWAVPFKPAMTETAPFTRADQVQIEVPMMVSSSRFPVWETAGGAVALLPFQGGLQMLLHLPDDPGATSNALPTAFDITEARTMGIEMPQLDLSVDLDLSAFVEPLGIAETIRSGLERFTTVPQEPGPLLQAVRLSVNEAGAEVVAATSLAASRTLIFGDLEALRFDRPFDLYIYDPTTGTTILAAHVADPTGGAS